jgi:Transposase, Mutator family
LARVPRVNAEMVAAAIRTIFAQPDRGAVDEQFDRIVAMLEAQFPDVAAMLSDARHDLLAFAPFPLEHWRKVWSTNPLERLHPVTCNGDSRSSGPERPGHHPRELLSENAPPCSPSRSTMATSASALRSASAHRVALSGRTAPAAQRQGRWDEARTSGGCSTWPGRFRTGDARAWAGRARGASREAWGAAG